MPKPITEQFAISLEEPLARLIAFRPTTFPVLSVYLNMQPDNHGRMHDPVPYLRRRFSAFAKTWKTSSAERDSFVRDVERILAYASNNIYPACNGVAMFACWGAAEFFEVVQMVTRIGENQVFADSQPHLYHLCQIEEQYPRYAAVLTDRGKARIYIFGLGRMIAADAVHGRKVERLNEGGWSEARYQRRLENANVEYANEVLQRLAKIVREDKVSHIILAGDSAMLPLLLQHMPHEMVPMAEVIKLGIHASKEEVMIATLHRLEEQEAR